MSEQHSRQVGRQPRREPTMKVYECPPALVGDCKDVIYEFLRAIRHRDETATPDMVASLLGAFATEHAGANVAAYLACAVSGAGSEIAESINRLARTVENLTPATEPPTLVRLKAVSQWIGLSSDSIMRMSIKGEFPKPIYLDSIPFFREAEVNEWLTAKAA